MRTLIDVVQDGLLGEIHTSFATFCTSIPNFPGELRWCPELGGGALMDLGCYPIHALRSLMGEEPQIYNAHSVYSRGVDVETEAEMQFPSGARGRMRCSIVTQALEWHLELVGSKGHLLLSNFIAPQFGCSLRTEIGRKLIEKSITGPSTYEEQLAHVVDVIAFGTAPLTGGRDAVANMATIAEIRRQAQDAQ